MDLDKSYGYWWSQWCQKERMNILTENDEVEGQRQRYDASIETQRHGTHRHFRQIPVVYNYGRVMALDLQSQWDRGRGQSFFLSVHSLGRRTGGGGGGGCLYIEICIPLDTKSKNLDLVLKFQKFSTMGRG